MLGSAHVCPMYNYYCVSFQSFVRKLLPQLARDRHQTWKYYGAPHGDGYKGADGR